MINGNRFDWESVQIRLPGGEAAVGISEINYNDERPIEERYGKGSKPRGYGKGNYKATGSLTIDRDSAAYLQGALGGSFYNTLIKFPITVSYANADQVPITDILPDCLFTKVDTGAKQGESNVGELKLDFKILSPIRWGGIEAV